MAFKPSKSKKHDTKIEGTLNMNSMMDMMTIILLFLLKSYSTTGALAAQSESPFQHGKQSRKRNSTYP